MADVCAVWPGPEPARSVVALLVDLLEVLHGRTGSDGEAAVHARRRGTDWFVTASGARLTADGGAHVTGPGPWTGVLGAGTPLVLPDVAAARADGHRGLVGPDGPGAAPGVPGLDRWGPDVLARGFRCVVAVPAPLPRGGCAVLTLYLDDAGACGPEVVRRAGGFAQQIASLIDLHSTIPARGPAAEPVGPAARVRATVDHAVGVLMEARGCDEDEARHVLSVLAAEQHRPLEVVALSVVQHAVRPADDAPRLPLRRAD